MPSAVLTEYQLALGHADRLRADDLVGGLFFQVAVLVNARFMRKRILAHNCLIRLRPKRDAAGQQLARAIQLFSVDGQSL